MRARLAARGFEVSEYSIRHKASRLDLAADMLEFTPAGDVASEAGVSLTAVCKWVRARGYRKHCRKLGRRLLLPLPVVRLYLHERRAPSRPRGWWGVARAADVLRVHVSLVQRLAQRGTVDAVLQSGTLYLDPHSVHAYAASLTYAPTVAVPVRALAAVQGWTPWGTSQALRRMGAPLTLHRQQGRAPGHYTTADHARAFLADRGHREEQVETMLRRALQQGAKVKGEQG